MRLIMKNKVIMLVFALALLIGFGFAWNLVPENVTNGTALYNSCVLKKKDIELYIPWSSVIRKPYETFANITDSIISLSSKIKIWRNWNNISACDDWNRVSNIVPASVKVGGEFSSSAYKVIMKEQSCNFNIPTTPKASDPNRIDSIIYYDIAYGLVRDHEAVDTPNPYITFWYYRWVNQTDWNCYPGGNVVNTSQLSSCPEKTLWSTEVKHRAWDCLVYRTFRCGDGIVNNPRDGWSNKYDNGTFTLEVCDDGWAPGGCRDDCLWYETTDPDEISCDLNIIEASVLQGKDFDISWNVVGSMFVWIPKIVVTSSNSIDGMPYGIGTAVGSQKFSTTKVGTYNFSLTVMNSDGNTDTCTETIVVNESPWACGDSKFDEWENCESVGGSSLVIVAPGSGCDPVTCTLEDVSCVLKAIPNSWSMPFTTKFTVSKTPDASWVWVKDFRSDYKDHLSAYPVFPFNYTYPYVNTWDASVGKFMPEDWVYHPEVVVFNDYDGITRWTIPSSVCKTDVKVNYVDMKCPENMSVTPSVLYNSNTSLFFTWDTLASNDATSLFFEWEGISKGLDVNTNHWSIDSYPNTSELNYSLRFVRWYDGVELVCYFEPVVYWSCGNGKLDDNEMCDDGSDNGTAKSGCSSDCKLKEPQCELFINPDNWNINDSFVFSANKNDWASYTYLDYGNNKYLSNPSFGHNYNGYSSAWTYTAQLTVRNNYDGAVSNWSVFPTSVCSDSVVVNWEKDIWIDKILIGNANHVYHSGDYVLFRINFGNNGALAAHVNLYDNFPDTVKLIDSSIYYSDGTVIASASKSMWSALDFVSKNLSSSDSTMSDTELNKLLKKYEKICKSSVSKPSGITLDEYKIAVLSCVQNLYESYQKTQNSQPVQVNDYLNYNVSVIGTELSNTSSVFDSSKSDISKWLTKSFYKYSSSDHYLKYSDVELDWWVSWYVLITGQILESCNGSYINTWSIRDITLQASIDDTVWFNCEWIPSFWLNKTNINSEHPFGVSENVVFHITFGNTGSLDVLNGYVCDDLPVSLDYVGSSISINNSILDIEPVVNWKNICYENVNIPANSTGLMVLTGKVSDAWCINDGINVLNTWYMYGGGVSASDTDIYLCNTGIVVWKTQSVSGSVFTSAILDVYPMDVVEYKIWFENVWGTSETIHVYDLLPTWFNYISGSIDVVGINLFTWIIGDTRFVDTTEFVLAPDMTWEILITWQIISGLDIIWNQYRNVARIWEMEDEVLLNLTGNLPILWLDKELLWDWVSYVSGDEVWFRVSFGNSGYSVAENITIIDNFPASLHYDSYKIINGWIDASCSSMAVDSDDYKYWLVELTCTWLDVSPFSSGYILMTGTLYSNDCSASINGATIPNIDFDTAEFSCSPLAYVNKTQSVTWVYTDEDVFVYLLSWIDYKIDFENNGWADTSGGIIISDLLPFGVDYVRSSIVVRKNWVDVSSSLNISSVSYLSWSQWYLEFSWFDLESLQTWHVSIAGVISWNRDYSVYTNNAFIEFSEPYLTWVSNEVVALRDLERSVLISKNIVDLSWNNLNIWDAVPTYLSGEDIYFEIDLHNVWDDVSSVVLSDVWPDLDCVDFSGWVWSGFTRRWSDYIWDYDGVFSYDETLFLWFSGRVVSDSAACLGVFANTWIVEYVLSGSLYTGIDTALFEIVQTDIIIHKTADVPSIEMWNLVTFYLNFENAGTNPVEGLVVSDIWPWTLSLMPSLTATRPYVYFGDASIDEFRYTAITWGWLLEWEFDSSYVFEPGMTGLIVLTGKLIK